MKLFFNNIVYYSRLAYRNKNRHFYLNLCLIILILLLLIYQLFHQKSNNGYHKIYNENVVRSLVEQIRNIPILNENFRFNITYNVTNDRIPSWLNRYGISHFFNYYWLQNEAYLWHIQRMFHLKHLSYGNESDFQQIFYENDDQVNILSVINDHPEYGVIIDTSFDPIPQFFARLPKAALSLERICQHYEFLTHWSPCTSRSEIISQYFPKPLITYALYDVTIDIFQQFKSSNTFYALHFDELIFLFDSQQQINNQLIFVTQILPRLIRLLALVPNTAFILLPHIDSIWYVSEYVSILIDRGLVKQKERFVVYNSSEIYHANVIYSTSSPRSDLILLNKVLNFNTLPIKRDLILVIKTCFDDSTYYEMIETINQFELPADYEYLHIHEYRNDTKNMTIIGNLFQRARIVIGMPTNILSHIVWCSPGTHIIEVIQSNMTTDYYEISLQLKFNYWVAMITDRNIIDMDNFRYLMMNVLADIDK